MRAVMRRTPRPLREAAPTSPARGTRDRAGSSGRPGLDARSARILTIGELALGVAHDLGNQLAVIRACAAQLGELRGLDPDAREAVADLSIAVQRSAELTRRVLDFARGVAPRRGPVDLHVVLERTAALLRRATGTQVRVAVEAGARAPIVDGDPADLENALLNLGLNASEAMPRGGSVVFSTADVELDGEASASPPPGPYVRIVVADEGVGIPPADLARVFEPFFTTKPSGTGLGLPIVREVVERHGGSISVVSGTTGTTFAVLLPRAATAGEPPEGPAAA